MGRNRQGGRQERGRRRAIASIDNGTDRQEAAMKRVTMVAALAGMLLTAASRAQDPPPLVLEAKIPLGAVAGRIDHFAFDADRQLLFVAELGNNSVGIVDVKERKVVHRLSALREPQGAAWHPATRTLYVANAG